MEGMEKTGCVTVARLRARPKRAYVGGAAVIAVAESDEVDLVDFGATTGDGENEQTEETMTAAVSA